jgi:hypothetical protein
MFSSFLGKGKKSEGSPKKDALDTRGLEVVEDDPDTTWGLWAQAVAEQESRSSDDISPHSSMPDATPFFETTQQVGSLAIDPHDLEVPGAEASQGQTPGQRADEALQMVELHHHRIASTIRTLWGRKECTEYISKLIMDGGDNHGKARIGFNQDAAAAMMVMSDVHDELFGITQSRNDAGFGDFSVRTGYDGRR